MRPGRWFYTIPLRLRSLFRRRSVEQELDDELQYHLEQRIEEGVARGRTRDEAHYEALRAMEGLAQRKEECRDMRRVKFIEDLTRDVHYALRVLRRSPGFTAVAVLSLALGIGANTAIFSVIDALVLRTLPVTNPEQLVTFRGVDYNFIYAELERFRGLTQVFSGVSGICSIDRSNVTTGGPGGNLDPAQVRVGMVSGNYFSVLGVNALLGRTLTPDDDRVPGGHPVAVISYRYWERRFARDAGAVGRTFTLANTVYTILGVTPRSFDGDWVGRPTDIWVPETMLAQVMVELPPAMTRTNRMNYRLFGRLRHGLTPKQGEAAAQVVYQQVLKDRIGPHPTPSDIQWAMRQRLELEPAASGYSPQRAALSQPLEILMIVVGLVLLIACANVANLLMARAAARHREMAVRLAVGAGAGRIVRQLLTESILLSLAGGALGLLFAQWGTNALLTFAGSGPIRSPQAILILDLHPDARILAFTTALCLLTAILFGLAPAFRASRVSISPALIERGAAGGGFRLGKMLVVTQVALSLALLIGAGLFVRTLRNLKSQDLGFERHHLLIVWTNPGQTGRWGAAAASLYQVMEERISLLPGVHSVSPTVYGLLQGNTGPGTPVDVPAYAPKTDADSRAQWSIVGTKFFETLGLRLVLGRNFTERDIATSPQVTVLNESMARHFFGTANPLGKHFESWGVTKEVVGVVADAKYESPRDQDRRMFYLPYRQQLHRLFQTIAVAIRTTGDPATVAASVRREFRKIDPNLPVLRVETIEDQLNGLLLEERLVAALSGFFGALAALLACLGLYGVMAYTTARRTNEIGIRQALGATRGDVLGMVLKESLVLVAAGIVIGIPAALAATRLIAARLYGVGASDPVTIALAILLLLSVAALAGFLPARRAAHVDPMVALRYE